MGDVAISVPVIRACVEQYPQLRISILTRSLFKPFFRGIKNVTIIEADVKGRHKGMRGLWRLSKALKKDKPDAIADLHNVLRSNVLKAFLKIDPFVQIDKGRPERKALINGKAFQPITPIYQRYALVFEKLGYKIDLSSPKFPAKATINKKCKALLGDYNSIIGIAPFAAFKGKAYPLDLMVQVIKELSNDSKILLFGGGDQEIDALSKLELELTNVISLAGKLSLDEEMDIISNLDVMVSMDSANAHIAAMLNVEVISIWGVTHPYAGFYPFNQNTNNALLADRNKFPRIPTSIYGNQYPEGYENAIATVSPQNIIDKVRELLSDKDQTSS
ncbi:MAG: glycosyltransferase family 9 protein [Bacteroidia bacterium]|nr:glycosyltransferase family 9 protein [Bacteroidia bacterium]NND51947.1 glycosyltransferase family 9 protein [Flavobacteriaceae bacterium]